MFAFRTGGNGANCNDIGEVYFNHATAGHSYDVKNFYMYSLAGAVQDDPAIGTVVVGGSTVTPTSFTSPGAGQTIEWVSYDTNKATINPTTGVITGIAAGYVTISYQVVTTASNLIAAYGSLEILVMENQTAPSAGLFTAYSATTQDNNNGYITGSTTAMEYSTNGGGSYTTCTGTSITGLAAGDVLIRYAAKTGYYASPTITVNIPNQEQSAPTGMAGVSPTTSSNNDGKITGTTTAMEYKLKTDSSWIACSATETTGLTAGLYEVRYAAKTGFNVGTSADVTVPNQEQLAPNGLLGVAESSFGANDGIITGTTTAMEYKLVSGSVWTTCSDTETTALGEGLYEVRYVAKVGYNAGLTTNVSIAVEFHELEITLTKGVSDMTVNLKDWNEDHMYQIWTYQEIVSDTLLDTAAYVRNQQWIMSKEYTLGADYDSLEPDSSINFVIDDFVSPYRNYLVIVEILDKNGDYLGNIKESFTPADLGIVVINKVYVDDVYSALQEYETKEIKAGAEVDIEVVANDVPSTVYTATITDTNTPITSADSDNNFQWDISAMPPGKYTVEFVASNGSTTDKRNIVFYLYDLDYSESSYSTLSAMTVTSVGSGNYEIVPTFTGGNFYYTIEEPGLYPIFTSANITPAQFVAMGSKITHNIPDYGIYYIYGFVNRGNTATIDNMIYNKLTIARSGSPSTMTITPDQSSPVQKETKITFTASATIAGIGATPVLYSFYKEDATGQHLVKAWSSSPTLEWTAARVGEYAIIARAKGTDAGSMEVEGRIGVKITDSSEVIAEGVVITVNETELDNKATLRKPIEIKASATSTNRTDLLYKFGVIDDLTGGIVLQQYSPERTCVWIPERSGAYSVLVSVKNSDSYGSSDKTKLINITVNS